MKKRIWNQLKKAVMITAAVGTLGAGAVSAAEFEAAELYVPAVGLKQSAQWIDEEKFQAELTLEVSGLKELYKSQQENTVSENGQLQMENSTWDGEVREAEAAENTTDEVDSENTECESESAVIDIEDIESEEYRKAEENAEGFDTETGQTQQSEQENQNEIREDKTRYFLTVYISEYFQVNAEVLKNDLQAESVQIQNKKGETTQITKLTCETALSDAETDIFTMKVPVSLREEYRISSVKTDYPLCQDAPLCKDWEGTGAYFWMKSGDETRTVAETPSALLSVQEAKTGITARLQQETKEVRAGQNLTYILSVENTGELPLENIEISSVFSQDNIKAEWKQEEGFTANGMQGIISGLKAGEIRNLQMTVQLTEEQAGELIHTVTVKAKYPGKEESIGCQKSVETEVIALKAAFEVEKTADRTQAYPGDTITYQICIRNTGERTLHSVLSTERFQNAGIQANFVRKEGVTLNSTGTQALIPQIAPGEAFALYATVTVPQYMASQELINEVIVTSDETGTQAMTSKANVELKETNNIVTVTPQPASLASQSYGYDSKSGSAYTTASKPRTGDETETALYIVLGIFAIMSGVSAFCYRKTKKQQK